jgi:hypothetical protein
MKKILLASTLVLTVASSNALTIHQGDRFDHGHRQALAAPDHGAVVFADSHIPMTGGNSATTASFSDRSRPILIDTPISTYPVLDNGISPVVAELAAPVAAVPEPGTYALVLAGLAGIAFVMRQKKQR